MFRCLVDGCERTNRAAQGLCWLHYQRQRRTGSTEAVAHVADRPLHELVNRRESSECWEYLGPRYPKGYGRHGRDYAHRLAWSLANHRDIPPGAYVCHHCDNPPCCNPEHLYLGTAATNAQDRTRRGRNGRGYSKLTAEQVQAIRSQFARGGVSKATLGREFGVSEGQIGRIVRREHWSHLP